MEVKITKYTLIASVGISTFIITGCATMPVENIETNTVSQLETVKESEQLREIVADKNKMPKLNITYVKQNGDDVVCKVIFEPGSRLRGKKYCFSKKTWDDISDKSTQIVDETQELFYN